MSVITPPATSVIFFPLLISLHLIPTHVFPLCLFTSCLFLSGFELFNACLAWEEDTDGWMGTPWHVCALALSRVPLYKQHVRIPVCVFHLHNLTCMCLCVCVLSKPHSSITGNCVPLGHKSFHRGDPCDPRYVRPPAQLLGAQKSKLRETRDPFLSFWGQKKVWEQETKTARGKRVEL